MLAAAASPADPRTGATRSESPPGTEQPVATADAGVASPPLLEASSGGWSTADEDYSPPSEQPPVAFAVSPGAKAEPPPAASSTTCGRRASADKRNRRCAVIENTIIGADGDGFMGTTATLAGGVESETSSVADPGAVVYSLRVDDCPVNPEPAGVAAAVCAAVPVSAPEIGEDVRIGEMQDAARDSVRDALDVRGGDMQDAAEFRDSGRDARSPSPVTVEEEVRSDAPSPARPPALDQNVLRVPQDDLLQAYADADAEPETSLNADLALANETNEASLPKIRKLSRRKSSLRRTADLEAEDGDSHDSSRPASLVVTSPTSRQTLSAMTAMSENTAAEGDVGMGEEEASGAAVALKRRLSLRLSAMSAYNPETDSDTALHRNSSSKGGGLRASRARMRHESLRYRRRADWDSPSDAAPSRASANETDAEGRQDDPSGDVRSAAFGHRKSRSYGGLDRERPRSTFDWRKLAPITDQSAGSLTETVIGRNGELIVLGPSIPARRSSDSDRPDGSHASRSPSPTPAVADGDRPPQISVFEADQAQAAAKDSGEAKLSPTQGAAEDGSESQLCATTAMGSGDSKLSPTTSPNSPNGPLSPAEVSSPPLGAEKTGALAPANRPDSEAPKGKALGKNQQHQGHAPPLPSSAKQKLSSAFSWFFGEGDAGTNKKSAATNASSPAPPSASSPAASGPSPPADQSGIASVPSLTVSDGNSPLPTTGESVSPTAPAPASVASAKEGRHKKASAALSALFSVRGSKSSTSKAAADSASAKQQGGKLTSAEHSGAAAAERFPLHVERAIYRLSHAKLANPRRPLSHQVVISNMMFWYLALLARQQPKHTQTDQRASKAISGQHSDDEEDGYGEESDSEERQRRRKAKKKAEKDQAKKAEKEGKKKKKDTRH